MGQIQIDNDGVPISGSVKLDGGKHGFAHTLACIALCDSAVIREAPDHVDARALREMLALYFDRVDYDAANHVLTIGERRKSRKVIIGSELASKSRSTFGLLPSALISADTVVLEGTPQGCDIGDRPTNWYLSVLEQFGVKVEYNHNETILSWPIRRRADVSFAYPTMTGTVIAIAAAAATPGRSTVRNGSVEPSCDEMQECLRQMGGSVMGSLPDLEIEGGQYKHVDWTVSPDRIHAVTYLTAGLLSRGKVTVHGEKPINIPRYIDFLQDIGAAVVVEGCSISAAYPSDALLAPVTIVAGSEPLFSSDWVPFASLLLAIHGRGKSEVSDDVFLRRFQYVENLVAFGLSNVRTFQTNRGLRTAVYAMIDPGVRTLTAGSFGKCSDIRGSAALVLAGLVADGPCIVEDDLQVKRGYSDIAADIRRLGNGHIKVNVT